MSRTVFFLVGLLATESHGFVATFGRPPPSPNDLRPIPSEGFVRDAEIKHGRIAAVSGVVLAGLAASGYDHPTAALSECSAMTQLLFFSALGAIEAGTYLPRLSSRFSLKEGVVPGELLPMISAEPWLVDAELNALRVAMVGVLSYMLHDVTSYL